MVKGKIVKVSGPLVIAEGMRDADMFDVVKVSEQKLIGEIIEMHGDRASIQVYEETQGLGLGDEVISTGAPLSVELGPGLISSMYDGIQRPLTKIRELCGSNIKRGIEVFSLDREKLWHFTPMHVFGDLVGEGDLYGTVKEAGGIVHKIMVPPGKRGTVIELREGDFTVAERIGKIKLDDGTTCASV